MASLLEHARNLHEEVSTHEQNIVEELLNPHTNEKKRVLQEHEVLSRLKRIAKNEQELLDFYADDDQTRAKELRSFSGRTQFNVFYERLNEVRRQNQRFAMRARQHDLHDIAAAVAEGSSSDIHREEPKFSGEEYFGTYVDLNEFYNRHCNIKAFPSKLKKDGQDRVIDYKTFLKTFSYYFHHIKKASKGPQYHKFLEDLFAYLSGFHARKYPLFPVKKAIARCEEEFARLWDAKRVEGWQKPYPKKLFEQYPSPTKFQEHADKAAANPEDADANEDGDAAMNGEENDHAGSNGVHDEDDDAEDDEDGSDEDEDAEERELYCKPCKKQFAKDSVFESHLKGRKHKKALKKQAATATSARPIAELEFKVKTFAELLHDAIEETCSYIDKKQTRTHEEIQREREELENDDQLPEDDEAEEEDGLYTGGVYNPKKLPEGWDGKPIPYWLYKFHGLDKKMTCEICRGATYEGPRAFNRHFQEARHAMGMRELGIPNTREFHNITKIEDAQQLFKRIQGRKNTEVFNPLVEEELEDAEGNVYDKHTYHSLRLQGVIQ